MNTPDLRPTHSNLAISPAPGWHVVSLKRDRDRLRVDVEPLIGWVSYVEHYAGRYEGDESTELAVRPAAVHPSSGRVVIDGPPFAGLAWKLTDQLTLEPWFCRRAGLEGLLDDTQVKSGTYEVNWYDRGELVVTLVVELDDRRVARFHYLADDGKPDTSNGGGMIL